MATLATLRTLNLTAAELQLAATCIYQCGSGQHPYPDATTVAGFTIAYAAECAAKAATCCPPQFKPQIAALITRLGEQK